MPKYNYQFRRGRTTTVIELGEETEEDLVQWQLRDIAIQFLAKLRKHLNCAVLLNDEAARGEANANCVQCNSSMRINYLVLAFNLLPLLRVVPLDGGAHEPWTDGRRSIQVEIECELSFCPPHSVAKPTTHYTRSIIPRLLFQMVNIYRKRHRARTSDGPTKASYSVLLTDRQTGRQSVREIGDNEVERAGVEARIAIIPTTIAELQLSVPS